MGLWFSLLSYFIPISLLINMEIVKYIQGRYLSKDKQLTHKDKRSFTNTSNLMEELGEVEYIFSDKTGTLT